MAKNSEITVKDVSIKTMNINGIDYICITDIAKQKNIVDPNGVVANWMRNRNTIEYLGLWETLHNTEFNPLEFEGFRKEAGLNAFTLSPTRWIEATNAIGLVSKSGRTGGTYAISELPTMLVTDDYYRLNGKSEYAQKGDILFREGKFETNTTDRTFHEIGHLIYEGRPQSLVIDYNNYLRNIIGLPKRKYDEKHNRLKK